MEVDKVIKTYIDEKKESFRLLANKTNELLLAIFKSNNIVPHSVTFREKDPEKLREKISRHGKKYITPLKEITDLAGVRVITYFPSDIEKILPLITENFVIDTANSIDKRRATDPSMFGYASVHLVVEFTDSRLNLPEYAFFKGMKCEIQVRTILQHAWAEIEHDIVYKSHDDIPFELRRKFASLAGLLEIADREFETLKSDELKVRKEIKNSIIRKDNIDISIDLDSLGYYMIKYHDAKNFSVNNLRGLIKLINTKNIETLRNLNNVFCKPILDQADEEVKTFTKDLCELDEIEDCDLRYFFAFAIYFKIPFDQIYEYSYCPALDTSRALEKVSEKVKAYC